MTLDWRPRAALIAGLAAARHWRCRPCCRCCDLLTAMPTVGLAVGARDRVRGAAGAILTVAMSPRVTGAAAVEALVVAAEAAEALAAVAEAVVAAVAPVADDVALVAGRITRSSSAFIGLRGCRATVIG